MLLFRSLGIALGIQAIRGVAASSTVKLDNTTFVGQPVLGVVKFLGIPFAQPP
jgi:hypothetical protein